MESSTFEVSFSLNNSTSCSYVSSNLEISSKEESSWWPTWRSQENILCSVKIVWVQGIKLGRTAINEIIPLLVTDSDGGWAIEENNEQGSTHRWIPRARTALPCVRLADRPHCPVHLLAMWVTKQRVGSVGHTWGWRLYLLPNQHQWPLLLSVSNTVEKKERKKTYSLNSICPHLYIHSKSIKIQPLPKEDNMVWGEGPQQMLVYYFTCFLKFIFLAQCLFHVRQYFAEGKNKMN